MEDENKVTDTLKKIGIILIIIIVLVLSIFLYKWIMTNLTNKNFQNYLNKNGYAKNEYGIYEKNEGHIIYKALFSESIIIKMKYYEENQSKFNFSLYYKPDSSVEIYLYEDSMIDENSHLYQTATYTKDNFTCEIKNANNIKPKCDLIKKEAIQFKEEIDKTLKIHQIKDKTTYKQVSRFF